MYQLFLSSLRCCILAIGSQTARSVPHAVCGSGAITVRCQQALQAGDPRLRWQPNRMQPLNLQTGPTPIDGRSFTALSSVSGCGLPCSSQSNLKTAAWAYAKSLALAPVKPWPGMPDCC